MVSLGIGANTLKALSVQMKGLLTDSCVVKRTTGHVSDGAMGYSDTLTTVGTYACYVDVIGRRGGVEDVGANRITVEDRYTISFMAGTVINPQDQITQVSSGAVYVVTNNIDNVTNSPLITVNASYASK